LQQIIPVCAFSPTRASGSRLACLKSPHKGTMSIEYSTSKSSTSQRTRAEVRYEVRGHCARAIFILYILISQPLNCRTASDGCAFLKYPKTWSIPLRWLRSTGKLGRSRGRPGLSRHSSCSAFHTCSSSNILFMVENCICYRSRDRVCD